MLRQKILPIVLCVLLAFCPGFAYASEPSSGNVGAGSDASHASFDVTSSDEAEEGDLPEAESSSDNESEVSPGEPQSDELAIAAEGAAGESDLDDVAGLDAFVSGGSRSASDDETSAERSRGVVDGVFTIACFEDPRQVLDVVAGSQEAGANVTLWSSYSASRQKYRITSFGDGTYKIAAIHSGQVLDVVASGATSGTNVTQWPDAGTENQRWVINETENGSYRISSVCNGLFLGVSEGIGEGVNVAVFDEGSSAMIDWSLIPSKTIDDGVYTVALTDFPGQVLDVTAGSSEPGANITLWDETLVRWQKFEITYLQNGYYKFKVLHSRQVMDVVASGTVAGTNVTQWTDTGAENQQWDVVALDDGGFKIVSRCNGMALIAVGAAAGSNVEMGYSGYASWTFSHAEEPSSDARLSDGVYVIANASSPSFVLDVVAGSMDPGANVTLWTGYGNDRQRYRVTYVGDGYYKIVAQHSGQALDVVASSGWPEANVTQWTDVGTDNQLWKIVESDEGGYLLISKCSGLVLGCDDPARDGANVKMETPTGAASQRWGLQRIAGRTVADGVYTIGNGLDPNQVLDVVAGSSEEGANVTLWEYTNPAWQRFKVSYVGDGYYRIAPLHSGQTLDVVASGTAPGTNVTQWSYFENANQLWRIDDAGDGSYRIVSRCNGLALDIEGSASNGTNVMVDSVDESDAGQTWVFTRCSTADSFKVYLDAGHGWGSSYDGAYDPGAVSFGYVENELTNELVDKVAALCRDEYGLCVYANTYGGQYKSRHSEAVRLGCSTFLSFHFNSGGGTGTETYIHIYNAATGSAAFQDIMHRWLVAGTGLVDRGQKASAFAVVGGPLPAVLMEVAFIDNAFDMGRYSVDSVARFIASGINEAAHDPACLA